MSGLGSSDGIAQRALTRLLLPICQVICAKNPPVSGDGRRRAGRWSEIISWVGVSWKKSGEKFAEDEVSAAACFSRFNQNNKWISTVLTFDKWWIRQAEDYRWHYKGSTDCTIDMEGD